MVNQLLDDLLHLRTKQTNRMIPWSDYIGINKFPTQADDIKKITVVGPLKYRDDKMMDLKKDEEPDPIQKAGFIIVRHDIEPPYRFIAIKEDYSLIVTCKTGPDNQIYSYFDQVMRVPIQETRLIGLEVENQYLGEQNTVPAMILRADTTEPCYCIMVENIGGKIRFVLGDECMTKIGEKDPDTMEIPKLNDLGSYKSREQIIEIIRNCVEGKEIWY